MRGAGAGGRHSRYVWDGRAIRALDPGERAGRATRSGRLRVRLDSARVRRARSAPPRATRRRAAALSARDWLRPCSGLARQSSMWLICLQSACLPGMDPIIASVMRCHRPGQQRPPAPVLQCCCASSLAGSGRWWQRLAPEPGTTRAVGCEPACPARALRDRLPHLCSGMPEQAGHWGAHGAGR